MSENEKMVKELETEKNSIEKLLEEDSISNPAELDQLELKLKNLKDEINQRKDKNEFLNYFLETGDILYNYYDMQEKIQNGDLLTKQNNKRKPGSILDVLEKADEEPIVAPQQAKQSFLSRDKLLEEYLKKVHPENVRTNTSVLDDTFGECDVCEKEMVFCGKAKSFVNEYGDKVVAPAFSKGKYTFTARLTILKPKLVTTPAKEIVFTVR
jgi:DNA repair exonuclease SbcCD ATPase subunit